MLSTAFRRPIVCTLILSCVFALAAVPVVAQEGEEKPTVRIPSSATVESLFIDFLHYAKLGRFQTAEAYAQALLAHPELNPVTIQELAARDPESIQTLLILVKNSTIGDSAARVLELIQQGKYEKRKEDDLIRRHIAQLGGDPQQEFMAIKHLTESGEYSIPLMVAALQDPGQQDLRSRIVNALPKIGKAALNPLVEALQIDNNDLRVHFIAALGEIGYEQAVPYLQRLIVDPDMPALTKQAAADAIRRIASITGRPMEGAPDQSFFRLAEKFYNEDPSVRADSRIDEANIWYWNDETQSLMRIPVVTRIFGPVMAMRTSEAALELRNDNVGSIALWVAANIRREARLGLDIESGDPNAQPVVADATRPDVFPRALYFSQSAGPRYAHLVLGRAVADADPSVALGAIRALRLTSGEASLVGTEDFKQPLVQALRFPNTVVRIRAALALGAALPKSQFADSEFVVPVLADALQQTGRQRILVIDPDESNRNRVMDALRDSGTDVIGAADLYGGLERARREFETVSAIYIASDVGEPGLAGALPQLRGEFRFAQTPVIVLIKSGDEITVDDLAERDAYVEAVLAGADDAQLASAFEEVAERTAQKELDESLALELALEAAEVLRLIAIDGATVYDWVVAEAALIGALSATSEDLQIRAAAVLALAGTETSQRAIAHVALDESNTKSLRIAAFGSLTESAKNAGNKLEADQVTALVKIAKDEPDLELRTAASQALGGVNLANNQASEIIRSFSRG